MLPTWWPILQILLLHRMSYMVTLIMTSKVRFGCIQSSSLNFDIQYSLVFTQVVFWHELIQVLQWCLLAVFEQHGEENTTINKLSAALNVSNDAEHQNDVNRKFLSAESEISYDNTGSAYVEPPPADDNRHQKTLEGQYLFIVQLLKYCAFLYDQLQIPLPTWQKHIS